MGRKSQGWETQKVNALVQQAGPGGGRQEGVCRCSFSVLLSTPLAAASARLGFFGNWPKALMKAGGAQRVPASQGALCLSRLSAFSEETHHHPALSWIRAFEVLCLICVTASVTQHKTCSGFILSLLQFHPPGIATRDKTEPSLTCLEIAGVRGTCFPRESN